MSLGPTNFVTGFASNITAPELNAMVQICPNVAALRQFIGQYGQTVFLAGTTTANDGGQALYTFQPGTATDNGTSVIVPTGVFPPAYWQQIPFNQAGTGGSTLTSQRFVANGAITPSSNTGAFSYGTLSYSDTNIFSELSTSVNSYAQSVLVNQSAGAAASSDFIVGNNQTTATTYYGDFGMNSSNFTGSGSLNLANAVYVYAANGDLVLGTTTANGIHFVVNGGATDALSISSLGLVQVSYGLTGTLAQNSSYLFNPQMLGVWSTSDNQVSAATPGTNIPTMVSFEQYFGGTSINDGRNTLGVALHMTAPTAPTNGYKYYAAGNFLADTGFNDGGTGGTPKGAIYGIGAVARLKSGATNWQSGIAADFEVSVEAGASALIVTPVAALAWPAHAVHGSLVDAGVWISSGSATGFYNGIQIDDSAGYFAVPASGSVIKAFGAGRPQVAHGADLSGVSIAGYLIKGDGLVGGSTTTVAALPAAASNKGARTFVSDSTVDYVSANAGANVVGGGAYCVPVWCDGIHWRIG